MVKKTLAMPIELIEAFEDHDTLEYRKIVNRNTLWIELVTGMLFYYGYMNIEKNDRKKYKNILKWNVIFHSFY